MSRIDDIKNWIVGIIDTGCAIDILFATFFDEADPFYDSRLKEQYPDVTREEVGEVVEDLKKNNLIRENGGMFFVNWEEWKKAVGSIPWVGQ